MFKNIKDPKTKKNYNIASSKGKQILNKYIKNYRKQKGGAFGQYPTTLSDPYRQSGVASRNQQTAFAQPVRQQSQLVYNQPAQINITTPAPYSVKIDARSTGPIKNYFDSFIDWKKNVPYCADQQIKEINLLIEKINTVLTEKTGNATVDTQITKLTKKRDSLNKDIDINELETLIGEFNTLNALNRPLSQYRDAQRVLRSQNNLKQRRERNLEFSDYRIREKHGLADYGQDLERYTRDKYQIENSNLNTENKSLDIAKNNIITALKNVIQQEIDKQKRGKNKINRKIFISQQEFRCRQDPASKSLYFLNMGLLFGSSITDRGAKKISIDIKENPNEFASMRVTITGEPSMQGPINIMVPRSIIVVDLDSIIRTSDPELDYIGENLAANKGRINENYETFVKYILNLVTNLNMPSKNSIRPFIVNRTSSGGIPSSIKIIDFRDETYVVDKNNNKHNIFVHISNFEKFDDTEDGNNIGADFRFSIIPSYDRTHITFTQGTYNIIINDYSKGSYKHGIYGDLNIKSISRGTIDNYALGIGTPNWCFLF